MKESTDYDIGCARTEVKSSVDGVHLGHKFDDGPVVEGARCNRYCINSASINFIPVKDMTEDQKTKYGF